MRPPLAVMKLRSPHAPRPALIAALSFATLWLIASPVFAQATAGQMAKYDKNKNGVLDPEEQRALDADVAAAIAPGAGPDRGRKDIVELSPFNVNVEKDNGFSATNAGTATKLGLDMKD